MRGRQLLYVVIFAVAFGTYAAKAYQSGRLDAPPEPGDSHDYDAIAFNLWKLRGYGYYWSDPEYRAPYEQYGGSSRYRNLLSRQSDYYPTAYRPPAFPVLLSATYAATDRNFAAWRLINCAIVAGAATLAAAVSAHFAGLLAAPVTAFLVLQSAQLTRSSQVFMTEGMAAFLVVLLAWLWVANSRDRWTIRRAGRFGLALGALLATRSIFVLWTPLAIFVPPVQNASGRTRPWLGRAVCLVCCLLVIAPWWIRNVVVTGAFMPTGTQAPLNLPSGFGPRALLYEGLWRSNRVGVEEASVRNLSPYSIEYEVELARIRSAVTLKWIREHPADVLRLMVLHVWQEIRPRDRFLWDLLLPAAGVALVYFRRTVGTGGVALMLGANIVSVALTWGAGGRFMLPVQPLMLALVCAMVVSVLAGAGRVVGQRLAREQQPA